MSNHTFFLSYASNDDLPTAPDPHMPKFWEELNRRVRYHTGAKEEGFKDRVDIKPGENWRKELVDALCSAPAMVCLYSESYFKSESCGGELRVFLDRRLRYMAQHRSGKRPANIIPILWHGATIPRAIPAFQFQPAPGLDPKDYGIWDLLDQKRKTEFNQIVNQTALRIRDATRDTPLPDPGYTPVFGGIPSAFEPSLPLVDFDSPNASNGPETVTFVYTGDPVWHCWPSTPPKKDAALHVSASVAAGFEYNPQELKFDPQKDDLVPRLREAFSRNNLVVFLVEGTSLKNESIQQRLREYDQQNFEGFSTIVVWPSGQHFNDAIVQNAFPRLNRSRPRFFFPMVDSSQQLAQVLYENLQALQAIVLKRPNNPNPLPSTSAFSTLPPLSVPGHQVGI